MICSRPSIRAAALAVGAVLTLVPRLDSQQPAAVAGELGVGGEATGTISGVVRDFTTGQPVADASVNAVIRPRPPRPVSDTTDDQGRFTLTGVPAGTIRIGATKPRIGNGFPRSTSRFIDIAPGQQVEGIDVTVRDYAQITGTVTDQNGEPAPGMRVILVAREWQSGELRYVYAGAAGTDDQGNYTLERVDPGAGFLVMVTEASSTALEPISNVPLDPALRRPAFVPTYYPGVTEIQGAQLFTLQPGETRENVDLQIARSPSYCLQGPVNMPGYEGPVRVGFAPARPHSGPSGNGGFYMSNANATVAAGSEVRFCGLAPGEYRVTAYPAGNPNGLNFPRQYSSALSVITDSDTVLPVNPLPLVKVPVELVWEGAPPTDFVPSEDLLLSLRTMTRSSMGESSSVRLNGEGPFELELFGDDYGLPALGTQPNLPPGVYWKDLLYGDRSVRYTPILPGSVAGNQPLEIVLAADGGTVRGQVTDGDGDPAGDTYLMLIPQDVRSESELIERTSFGQTDQNGVWSSPDLAPGAYYAVGSRIPFDRTPETAARLWLARGDAAEVEVRPGDRAEVTVEWIN